MLLINTYSGRKNQMIKNGYFDKENNEFVILKAVLTEDGETDLVDIEDDEEFDRVADYFEDEVFGDVDYDN